MGGEEKTTELSQHELCIRIGTMRRQHQGPEGDEKVAPGSIKSLALEQSGE